MDAYIAESKDPMSHPSFRGERGLHNMKMALFDLFTAGSDTTANTLNWSFYYFAKNPEIQTKLQAELDRVVGRDRLPTMEDRAKCHYLEATVQEVHRYYPNWLRLDNIL